jgi:hypothetical protein
MEELDKAKEDRLKTFLCLPKSIPAHDTFNRIFVPQVTASLHIAVRTMPY